MLLKTFRWIVRVKYFFAVALCAGLLGAVWARLPFAVAAPPALPAHASASLIYLPFVSNRSGGGAGAVPNNALWRFGIAQARRAPLTYAPYNLASLRLGWYVDWGYSASALPTLGMEYVPMARVKQWKLKPDNTWTNWCVGCPYVTPHAYTLSPAASQLRALAASRPGLTWAVGNEMERRDWATGMQDEIVPELYAQAYYEAYNAIKSGDPTAKVAIGGVIEATPLRLQYLDRVWSAYATTYGQTLPVDVWNLHIFVLPEKSCAVYAECWGAEIPAGLSDVIGATYTVLDNKNFTLAAQQVVAFRTWMANHGQRTKPLIITEYGVNMPDWVSPGQFTPAQVRDNFLYPSFDYFLNQTDAALGYPADGYRLVQRWNWYSLDDDSVGVYGQNFNGNLYTSGLQGDGVGFTTLGGYWQSYVQALAAGSAAPYTLAMPANAAVSARNVAPANAVPAACPEAQRVRAQIYEPSPARALFDPNAAPPQLVREQVLCVAP